MLALQKGKQGINHNFIPFHQFVLTLRLITKTGYKGMVPVKGRSLAKGSIKWEGSGDIQENASKGSALSRIIA